MNSATDADNASYASTPGRNVLPIWIGSELNIDVTKGPANRVKIRAPESNDLPKMLGNLPVAKVQQISAIRFGIESLSKAGTPANLIAACTGNSRKPPRIVHT